MAAAEEDTIITDPTPSSPPPLMTPAIKRAASTYGRRREPVVYDADTSLTYSEGSSASHQSTYSTGPDPDDELPPSSEPRRSFSEISEPEHADDEDEDEEKQDASPKFQFSWKKKLKELDEQDDFDGVLPSILNSGDASETQHTGFDTSLSHQREKGTGNSTVPTSPLGVEPISLSEDVFSGSVSTLTSSSTQPQVAFIRSPSPPSPAVGLARGRVNKRSTIVQDSDSDSGQLYNKLSPPATSPVVRPATARSASSPLPPTSDGEMPTVPFSKSETRSKGKGRASAHSTHRAVPPLRFDQDLSSTAAGTAPLSKNKSNTKQKHPTKTKIKAPTKREVAETNRDRIRIAADQHVSIPRPEAHNQKYSIQNFFTSIAGRPPSMLSVPSSSPIGQFTSSPAVRAVPVPPAPALASSPVRSRTLVQSHQPPPPSLAPAPSLPTLESDSDELPEVGDLLDEQRVKAKEDEKRRMLLEMKKKALAQHAINADSSDDDLVVVDSNPGEGEMHVVAEEEAEERRVKKAKHLKPSEGRKRQLMYGGVGLGQQRRHRETPGKKQEKGLLTQGELNKLLARKVAEENTELVRQKEAEWVRRGGTVNSKTNVEGTEGEGGQSGVDAWKVYAEKGRKAAEEQEAGMVSEEDDGSDEEWTPELRGSASPSPKPMIESADEERNDVTDAEDEDITMVNEDGVEDGGEGEEDKKNFRSRGPRRSRAVIDSDSDEENTRPIHTISNNLRNALAPETTIAEIDGQQNIGSPIVVPTITHRGSLSSFEEPTEDENDKENNTRLMYDKSEDKENKAVVQHTVGGRPVFGTRKGSLFGLEEGIRRGMSMSPGGLDMHSDEGDDENENDENGGGAGNPRKPFKELLADEDPFASPVISKPSFTARLQQASSSTTLAHSPPQLSLNAVIAPRFGNNKGGTLGFSQFLDDEGGFGGGDENAENAPLAFKAGPLQPGFSDLFESGTEKQGSFRALEPRGISESLPQKNDSVLDKLRKPDNLDDLPLTLDVGLQPALEVSDNVRRQADSIFEKEQAYVLEAANRKPKKKEELYVNDHGFLTQTRPEVSSPEVYQFASPSQRAVFFASQRARDALTPSLATQTTQRHPLRTLSLSDDLELDTSPNTAPLRRLTKLLASPPAAASTGYISSPSLSPSPHKRPTNAFEILAHNVKSLAEKPVKRLEKSEFVEAEAQESDDDEMLGFGFGKKKDGEEEEDGEDLDKTLEGLVDDQEMDDEMQGAEKVLEKFKEHQEVDDALLEKLHKDAAEGKLRVKRRDRGVGLEDSDDEDEDEKDRNIRRKMFKRRKVDRETIKALGEDETTRSFFEVYQHDLVDDDNLELAHLQPQSQDVVMDKADEGPEEPRESVTTHEIRERVREMAQQHEEFEEMNPDDVSWLDDGASEDETKVRVKDVSFTSRKESTLRRKGMDQVDFDGHLEQRKGTAEDEHARIRMQSWAKVEGRSRNVGTGRSAVGAAVTGHGKAKLKTGGGSLRTVSQASSSSTTRPETRNKPLKAAPSMLAGVADRSARFESC